MRRNFGVKTWLYPMPVLIVATYGENGEPDAMNAAWGGIHDTDQIGICIDPGHKTAENLRTRRSFTVSIADAAHVTECDYVGIVSARNEPEKLRRAGFHTTRSEFVDAPLIDELPMTLECRLVSYDDRTGCAVGEIVNVSADERILDAEGKIDPAKLRPLTFDPVHHLYRELGSAVGRAFREGQKLK